LLPHTQSHTSTGASLPVPSRLASTSSTGHTKPPSTAATSLAADSGPNAAAMDAFAGSSREVEIVVASSGGIGGDGKPNASSESSSVDDDSNASSDSSSGDDDSNASSDSSSEVEGEEEEEEEEEEEKQEEVDADDLERQQLLLGHLLRLATSGRSPLQPSMLTTLADHLKNSRLLADWVHDLITQESEDFDDWFTELFKDQIDSATEPAAEAQEGPDQALAMFWDRQVVVDVPHGGAANSR
jgi:hypothetical protein